VKTIAIIGSGIGGLTAGNLLARKGHKVTIFEAHGSPGGYTAGFRRQASTSKAAPCRLNRPISSSRS